MRSLMLLSLTFISVALGKTDAVSEAQGDFIVYGLKFIGAS